VLVTGRNLGTHLGWILLTLIVGVPLTYWYFAVAQRQPVWPGGSSGPGFACGVVGGAICFFELMLWWRKRVRTWRIGRVQAWMRAHIWFGLLCLPLLIFHSGFRLGGWLSAILLILVIVVVVSGIYGLILQQFLPSRMLSEVPGETIYSQIPYVTEQIAEEAERLVVLTCGPEEGAPPGGRDEQEAAAVAGTGFVTIGAVRAAGPVSGKVIQTRTLTASVSNSEPLREFYKQNVAPFLRHGNGTGSMLHDAKRAATLFQELRAKLDPAAHESVSALESICSQRRQFAVQERLHAWLHNWLCVHLPLSVALIVLMFLHIFVALKYW
jgi:hypothetical protein